MAQILNNVDGLYVTLRETTSEKFNAKEMIQISVCDHE